MPNYCLLAVEGPHDQAAITKLLKLVGYKRFDGARKQLDPFWEGFVPTYPKGGNLYTRMNMPSILTSPTHSVAIYWGEGSSLIRNLEDIVTTHERYAKDIFSFGLFVDADNQPPKNVAKEKATKLRSIFPTLSDIPGEVTKGTPHTGIYVLPDNTNMGVLDSALLNCASVAYPAHKEAAIRFIDALANAHTDHLRSFKRDKAVVACIVSILRPGSTNTSSIVQDNWISEETLAVVNDIGMLNSFLTNLLDIR